MRKACLLVSLVLGLSGWAGASTYDLNADLDFTTNPDGAWSYGYVQSNTSILYDMITPNVAGQNGLHVWCKTDSDTHGNVAKNTTGSDIYQAAWPNEMKWFAGKTHMMTPMAGYASGISTMTRFTAPTAGPYDISVDFLKASTGDVAVDVLVLVNGSSVLSEQINNGNVDASYDGLNVNLAAGQTVDLLTIPVAGSGSHDGGFVITQVDAVITPVPEPVTLGLLTLGGLLFRRKS